MIFQEVFGMNVLIQTRQLVRNDFLGSIWNEFTHPNISDSKK